MVVVLLIGFAAAPGSAASAQNSAVRPHKDSTDTSGVRWREVAREDFEQVTFLSPPAWRPDVPDAQDRYGDDGAYFHKVDPSFKPPHGFRTSAAFGPEGVLTIESYSRVQKEMASLFQVVDDPDAAGNRVARLASPDHTDGTLIRTTNPLGTRYQICARIGHINFGTGDGTNGYHGFERAEPWLQEPATTENGVYLGAIYRSVPRPHNNIWAHHARIAFIDTDNNTDGWTAIWDSKTRSFFNSGWHPLVMAVLDGRHSADEVTGPPILSYAGGAWGEPGEIVAADAYKENAWYTVCFTRWDDRFTMQLSGDFRLGSQTTYEAVVDDARAVFHFQDPHYWCAGDPHINYYEGDVLIDDIVLRLP